MAPGFWLTNSFMSFESGLVRVRARVRARVRVREPPRCDRGDGRLSRVGLGEVVDEEEVLLDRARYLG